MSIAAEENNLAQRSLGMRDILFWLAGSVGAYFLTGFFSNFHPLQYQFILLSLVFPLLCGTAAFLLFGKELHEQHVDPLAVLTLITAFGVSVSAAIISWQFP